MATLKGQCHEIFDFSFFSWISFPQAPEYTNRAVSNFFENSRRYSQLKVHHLCRWHRWQIAKIFKMKNFNYFVWTPLGSRVNIYINFCLQVQFKMTAAWYCTHYLPPVSMTISLVLLIPVAICRWRRWYRWQFATGVVDTGGKFAAGIVDTGGKFATGINNTSETGGKFATGVVDTGGAPWLANISANFRKNSKRSKWNTLGLGGNWLIKKTRSKKSRDTVPLMEEYHNIRVS